MADSISMTFMARPTAPITHGTPGHAFFSIGLAVGVGVKEECFGFYPENVAKVFWGPGKIKNDFNAATIPNVSISLRHRITEPVRTAVYDTIKKWAGADYGLLVQNCGDFMLDVVKSAGLKIPQRSEFMIPTELVEKLTSLYWSTSWLSTDAQSRFGLLFLEPK